jgi:UDP-glucose:(heptosyl)LPS alpha-1,3-glucosyltransferase
MRIAFNHRHFGPRGGAEGYLWAFARKLVERGHDVHLFCAKFAPEPTEGMTRHTVPLMSLSQSLKALSFARRSRKLLRGEDFDGILGFGKTIYGDIYRDGSGCMKHFGEFEAKYDAGARRSLSIKQAVFRHLERVRFSPGAFRHIVAISRMVKDQILSLYDLSEEDISVIHPGVDVLLFESGDREDRRAEIRKSHGLGDDEIVGMTVAGGFSKMSSEFCRKGVEPLLEALARVKTEGLRFMVLGRDRHFDRYEALVARLNLGSKIVFCGWREDVGKHMAASDFFVLNSRFDAFGNSTMEAMASALPCIVSAKAGSSEVVCDRETGFVVSDPDDAEELSCAMEELASDGELRGRMGTAALETARANTIDKNIDEYLAILEKLGTR